MRRTILAIIAGIALTLVSFFVSRYLRDNGHGLAAFTTFFPFSGNVSLRVGNNGWLVATLMVVQFPLYALIVATAKGARRKTSLVLIIVAIHALAALFALRAYYGSKFSYVAGATEQIVGRERRERVSQLA